MVETRPPISKAKMMSITKSALKGIKFYKHIVMNVEKFINKVKQTDVFISF
jgi:RNA-binding protein 16